MSGIAATWIGVGSV